MCLIFLFVCLFVLFFNFRLSSLMFKKFEEKVTKQSKEKEKETVHHKRNNFVLCLVNVYIYA